MHLDFLNMPMKAMAITLIIALLSCPPAHADIGVPMLILVWPASWALLLLIIPLEAYVAFRILKISYLKGLKLSGITNLISTLIGIPITWVILVVVQMLLGGGSAWGIDTLWGKILAVTVQSPWMIPYRDGPNWMLPAAAISLCIPFFFISVWVEYFIAAKFFDREIAPDKVKLLLKWSWVANLLSYGLIISGLVVLIIAGIVSQHR